MKFNQGIKDLFKIVGTESELQLIRDQYEKGFSFFPFRILSFPPLLIFLLSITKGDQPPDLSRFSEASVVASFKHFLLNLYESLIPLELYASFTAASGFISTFIYILLLFL